MRPAFSIIVFTVITGTGYGLLALLGVLAVLGLLPAEPWFAIASLGFALALVSGGLISSAFHLGRPERAWRAFSQWRSSWLSREGIAALATYVPVAVFALRWLTHGEGNAIYLRPDTALVVTGAVMTLMCLATIVCTAMIYATLKPVHEWCNAWVAPVYLSLALLTGALWLNALSALFAVPRGAALVLALLAILLAWPLKLAYWRFIDTTRGASSAESATGLGRFGQVRLLDPPHTEENYLQKEMGFRIARKHAAKLRPISVVAAFIAPLVLLLALALVEINFAPPAWSTAAFGLLAALLTTSGVLVERWLFFAEARHTVALYYGASKA